jgi:indolepyruvate ferredoxin oxidoreductase
MLGYAWQKGWIPLDKSSLLRAIELNAVQVDKNKLAFEWGCRAAHDLASMQKLLNPGSVIEFKKRDSLAHIIATRTEFLTSYQNADYAQTYGAFVQKVKTAEEALAQGLTQAASQGVGPSAPALKHLPLTEAVARYLFKLMAYKDEYEVARLHTDPAFHAKINSMFEGDFKLNYHLAPPLIAKRNGKGELQKQKFGPAMLTAFRLLAKLKGLRGGAFDVFGKTEERRQERALIDDYRASVEEVLQTLTHTNHASAVEIARIPELIKGYGHVKERNLKAARAKWAALMGEFRDGKVKQLAA